MIAELEASECNLYLYYLDACDETETILMETKVITDRPRLACNVSGWGEHKGRKEDG
jgi:hypothetical protein